MEKLGMKTKDISKEKFEILKELFPNAVTETTSENKMGGGAKNRVFRTINLDVIRQEINENVIEGKEERYEFTWPEKRKAIIDANTPINKTLRPIREDSQNFDTTENLYIEGDNLEVLKLLRETYLGKIKMIYIDPPYNTGNDFIYNDDFTENEEEYKEKSGNYDEDGNRLFENTKSNGRFHTDWLNMIYPRLKLARDLLTDDGVIFISIDDNEQANLKKVCDEIFGVYNYVTNITIINNLKGRSDDKFFATCNEFMLVYAKKLENLTIIGDDLSEEEIEEEYKFQDEKGEYKLVGLRKTGKGWKREERPFMYYPILYKNNKFETISQKNYKQIYDSNAKKFNDKFIEDMKNNYINLGYEFFLPLDENGNKGRWRWGLETLIKNINTELELNSKKTLCSKMRLTLENGNERFKTKKTVWYKSEYDTGSASKALEKYLNNIFENPKSLFFISDILKLNENKNIIILDFFSGSATTAHAVMQLNAEDGGNRKYIMVQLPEKTNKDSDAYKAGYKNICEIGKERIRRAAKKLKEENPNSNFDDGFRVLRVDSSNMKDVYYKPEEFTQENLKMFESNIKEDRTGEDLLFQVMLDLGIELSSKIEEKYIQDNKIYDVGENFLLACFDENITEEVVAEIAKLKPIFAIFKEGNKLTDNILINFEEIFKTYSPDTKRRVL